MFHAIVFKRLPTSDDFSQSQAIVLPGRYTEQEAWAAVHAAMRSGLFIGGEIQRQSGRAAGASVAASPPC